MIWRIQLDNKDLNGGPGSPRVGGWWIQWMGGKVDPEHKYGWHWGQGLKYPAGTCWTHWEHRQHVSPIFPVIKCWTHLECVQPYDPNVPSGQMLNTFWMFMAMCPQCTQQLQNWHILNDRQNPFTMCPALWSNFTHIRTYRFHLEFAQKCDPKVFGDHI